MDNVFKCFVYPEIWGLMWRGQKFFRRETVVTIGIGSTQIFVTFLLQVRFCFFFFNETWLISFPHHNKLDPQFIVIFTPGVFL